MKRFPAVAALVLLTSFVSCRKPHPPAEDREAIVAAVDGFHNALAQGDTAAATALLADDVQVLEEGERQTREEYLREHLGSDLTFAKAVPAVRKAMIVRQEGDVAWTTSLSVSKGTYLGREIDQDGAELMVLAKQPGGWRIRAIHWSGHAHR